MFPPYIVVWVKQLLGGVKIVDRGPRLNTVKEVEVEVELKVYAMAFKSF